MFWGILWELYELNSLWFGSARVWGPFSRFGDSHPTASAVLFNPSDLPFVTIPIMNVESGSVSSGPCEYHVSELVCSYIAFYYMSYNHRFVLYLLNKLTCVSKCFFASGIDEFGCKLYLLVTDRN